MAKVADRPGRPEVPPHTERLAQVPTAARPATVADLVSATTPGPAVESSPEGAPDPAPTREPVTVASLFEPRLPAADPQPAFGPRRPVEAAKPVVIQVPPSSMQAPIAVQRPGELPQRVRRTERVAP